VGHGGKLQCWWLYFAVNLHVIDQDPFDFSGEQQQFRRISSCWFDCYNIACGQDGLLSTKAALRVIIPRVVVRALDEFVGRSITVKEKT